MNSNDLPFSGLSDGEVKDRIDKGLVNASPAVKTKSVGRIFFDNICTMFNLINVILFVLLLTVGSYRNMLFIGVVITNTVIGIVQELRSKKSVDSLTILTDQRHETVRGGEVKKLRSEELVLDDVIILSRGSQVPADCEVIGGSCKVNESLLTGEADLIEKGVGDELLSGSFLCAGRCFCRISRVGASGYAARINSEAKFIKPNDSQILRSFRTIIRLCTAVIFPLGAILFATEYFWGSSGLKTAVESTVGALVGMIPGGMILLTGTVLAVSVIRLARRKVLVNEMYCIETLAQVDTLCLDKTGTLTSERMKVRRVVSLGADDGEIRAALSSLVSASDEINATLKAIGEYAHDSEPLGCVSFVPFSSETKRSGGVFENGKTYIIGAAEFLFSDKEKYSAVFEAAGAVDETVRILALASSDEPISAESYPESLEPLALVLIEDELRDNVRETIDYFNRQGVTLKVISGDSVETVRRIAAESGVIGAQNAVDMTTVTTDEELAEAAERCTVFGRVTPAQKKKLIKALRSRGHKVAMTGDGVNDVLALKEADCSVAMAAGSEAARNVSQLVLVNNDFACMPHVVAEGRRTINNIERSSSLYLVKTMYSIALAVFFVFFSLSYPFRPIQLTLIGALTVGFPSFVLALQPNDNIVKGDFTFNILFRAAPAALCTALSIIAAAVMSSSLGMSHAEVSTIAVYMTSLIGLMLIVRLSIPFNALRAAMLALSAMGLMIAFIFFGDFFMLVGLGINATVFLLICAAAMIVLFNLLYTFADKLIARRKDK